VTTEVDVCADGNAVRFLSSETAGGRFPELDHRRHLAFALDVSGCPGGIVVVDEPFDSEIFQRRIGRILDVGNASPTVRATLLERVPLMARREGFDQLLRRTEAGARTEAWALGRAGFEIVDVGVVFSRSLAEFGPAPARTDIVVRPATDDDIAEIACSMFEQPWGSRYEADLTYTPEQVTELRRQWLWNSHRGRADAVLVGELDGRTGGYATCVLDAEAREGDIELVGTLPGFRSRGVAGHLVAHALAWISDHADTATVHTQATNTVAVRVYERAGFTLRSCHLTFRISLNSTGGAR